MVDKMEASQETMKVHQEKMEAKMDTAINTVQERMETVRPTRDK
jgi:hypothetical protein